MNKKIVRAFMMAVCVAFFSSPALAAGFVKWNVQNDIMRLSREAPSLSAFQGAPGVIWLSDTYYRLAADGTTEKDHRLLALAGSIDGGDVFSGVFPYPADEGGMLKVVVASWHNPMTGMKEGDLVTRELDIAGAKAIEVIVPREARGAVIAIETAESMPKRYYLDDVIFFAQSLPIWEETVSVEVPHGMELYSYTSGIGEPTKTSSGGTERFVWKSTNQKAWLGAGLVEDLRPSLVFSMQKGKLVSLNGMNDVVKDFAAPPIPESLKKANGAPNKTGAAMLEYIADPKKSLLGFPSDWMRKTPPASGPWTEREKTLILAKWFSTLGWDVKVFWRQLYPVGDDGPGAKALWVEPALEVAPPKGKPVLCWSGQAVEFGATPPSLGGLTLYRAGDKDIETRAVAPSSASDNRLAQNWRLKLNENGTADGTLDLTINGVWANVLSIGQIPNAAALAEMVASQINFRVPGLTFGAPEISRTGMGYKLHFPVKTASSIVSQGDMLLRLPGGLPDRFEELARNSSGYTLRFPFMLEQNVQITTPSGYQSVMLTPAGKIGEAKSSLEEKMVYWPKKAQLEASSRWVVRAGAVDNELAKTISTCLMQSLKWSDVTVPLRKK